MNYELFLKDVLLAAPVVSVALASVGLATVLYGIYSLLILFLRMFGPFVAYLSSSKRVMATAWLMIVGTSGGMGIGHGWRNYDMWYVSGLIAFISSGIVLVLYWIRQWVKWCHNEKETT
jgi:hypothetical protein